MDDEPRRWVASQALNRPLTIAGCERTWFLLNGILAYALFTASYSFVFGAVFGAVGYAAGVLACREDPAMLRIVKLAQRHRVRYDPGKAAAGKSVPEVVLV